MAKNFPANPILGDQFEDWVFDGTGWKFAETLPGGLPCGSIIPWAGATAPANWLLCNGAAVSRTTYASLFGLIGTTYGAGDGSTTFNLPDLRGRVPVGKGSETFGVLGSTGGSETVTLTTAQMPSHTHIQDPHGHAYYGAQTGQNLTFTNTGNVWTHFIGNYQYSQPAVGSATATNQYTGGGQAHNNLQPYQVVNYIIKHTVAISPGESELAPRVGAVESGKANLSGAVFTGVISAPTLRNDTGALTLGSTTYPTTINGVKLNPNQPAFYARGAETSGTLGNGGNVPFSNAEVNIGNHFNTSTYRFTAPVAGMYQINTSLFNVGGSGRVSIKVNNASKYNSQNNWDTAWSWSGTIYLAANDYVTVGDWQSISGAAIYYGHSSFSGYLVG